MGRLDITNGSEMSLLGAFGVVDTGKAIDSIKYSTGLDVIDIGFINREAEKGKLFFKESGKPLDGVSKEFEKQAHYMIVPLGYEDCSEGVELCGSFMKGPVGWEGIYVGPIKKLVSRFTRYSNISDEEAESILENFRGYIELKGFGLTEVLEHNKDINKLFIYEEVKTDYTYKQEATAEIKEAEQREITETEGSVVGEMKAETVKEEPEVKEETKTVESVVKEETTDISLYELIYSRLIFKENWKDSKYYRLAEYIKHIIMKVRQEQSRCKETKGNGYIISKDGNKACINIGLIDKFNSDIFILDTTNTVESFYEKKLELVDSKIQLIKEGFMKADLLEMPKPVRFYRDKSELIFDGRLCDFDIDNINKLEHIVEERRFRFPDKYKSINADILCSKVRASVINAIKMSERDYKYFIPMYNFNREKIQFLIPIYLDRSIGEIPELSAVVDEYSGFYTVNTVLSTEDAYNNARLICKPDNTWLTKIEKGGN